tara:strand:+ start:117 stop:1049 length:933 start_codon:yes stop_codon:yes gene_type:complete
MNRTEILSKIKEIFGMVEQKFDVYKSEDGVEFRVDSLEMEKEIYIITPEGELPAPDGEILFEDGTKLKAFDGKIAKIEIKESIEEDFDEAELEDGTKVLTKEEGDFKVGDTLFAIDEEGNEVVFKEGEHTTKSGVVIVTDFEGKITGVRYPDTDGEGSLEASEDKEKMATATLIDGTIVETEGDLVEGADLYVKTEEGKQPAPDAVHETEDGLLVETKDGKIVSIKEKEEAKEEVKVEELLETFAQALEHLNNEITSLKTTNEELSNKFSTFAAEPAADKVYDRKGAYVNEVMSMKVDKLERLAQLRKQK